MAGRFARAQARLHRVCVDRLSDSIGSFHAPGCQPIEDIPLMIDRNLQYAGADGAFITDAVGVTFECKDVTSVSVGDHFQVGCELFVIERVIEDDGHMITAQTMVQT